MDPVHKGQSLISSIATADILIHTYMSSNSLCVHVLLNSSGTEFHRIHIKLIISGSSWKRKALNCQNHLSINKWH